MSLIAKTTVRLSAGAYTTSTTLGHRASSTQDADTAVKTLAAKIGVRHLSIVRSNLAVTDVNGQALAVFEIWGSVPGKGLPISPQSGFALDTLLLVMAGVIAAVATVGVIGLVLVFAGLIKLLEEME